VGIHGLRSGARRRVVLVVLALVSALLALGVPRAASQAQHAARCERLAAVGQARADIVTGEGSPVLVIGDSWSAGVKLDDLGGSWPHRLEGRVHVDGFGGSGFSRHASPCGRLAYADRVDAALDRLDERPALVVLQGGLNDADQSAYDIRTGVRRAVARLVARGVARTEIVIVGPAYAPARARQVPRVDWVLSEEAKRARVGYVRTRNVRLPYLADRLHLTSAGHAQFGDVVAARIAAR
jgi:acyl-CoA thioesterase-1